MRHATGLRSAVMGAVGFLMMVAYYGLGADAGVGLAVFAAFVGSAAMTVGFIAWFQQEPGRAELQLVTIGILLGLMAMIPVLHAMFAR